MKLGATVIGLSALVLLSACEGSADENIAAAAENGAGAVVEGVEDAAGAVANVAEDAGAAAVNGARAVGNEVGDIDVDVNANGNAGEGNVAVNTQ
jgi:hypothetical protein